MKFPFIKHTEKDDALPPVVHRAIAPSREFAAKGKAAFLARFDAYFRTVPAGYMMPRWVRWSVSVVGAFLLVISSGIVYASAQNVSADNPLYPFKRLGESVQLVFAQTAVKAQLHANFAVKRQNEIKDLEARHPSSSIIDRLNTDMDAEVTASLKDIAKGRSSNEKEVTNELCGIVQSTSTNIASGSIDLPSAIHSGVLRRLEERCSADDTFETFRTSESSSNSDVEAADPSLSLPASATFESSRGGIKVRGSDEVKIKGNNDEDGGGRGRGAEIDGD